MNRQVVIGILVILLLLGGVLFLLRGQILPNLNSTPVPEANQSQKPQLVCKRFTNLDEAVQNPEIACVLDLSTKEATPASIDFSKLSKLDKLVDLSLKGNNLTSVPKEILSLKSLMLLDLSDNKIKEIPDEIANLENLQILKLSNNSISDSEKEKIQNLLPQTTIEF